MNEDFGFVPIDSWGEQSFVVPIQQFDFDSLDDPEGYIKERIAAGRPIMPLVQAIAANIAEHQRAETIKTVAELLMSARNPKRRLEEILYACGTSWDGSPPTLQAIAKKYKTNKQTVHHAVKVVCERFSLRKPRAMWPEASRVSAARKYAKRKARDGAPGKESLCAK